MLCLELRIGANVGTDVRYISPITGPRFPEDSRKLRSPDFMTTAQNGSKFVSLTHRPFYTPQEILLVLISVRG